MKYLIATIATILFILFAKPIFGERADAFLSWNMHNLPFVVIALVYPKLKPLYRWIRFWIYA